MMGLRDADSIQSCETVVRVTPKQPNRLQTREVVKPGEKWEENMLRKYQRGQIAPCLATLNHSDLWRRPVPNCSMPCNTNHLASGNGPHQIAPSSVTEGIVFCHQSTILSFFLLPSSFSFKVCLIKILGPRQWPTTTSTRGVQHMRQRAHFRLSTYSTFLTLRLFDVFDFQKFITQKVLGLECSNLHQRV